jgi:peptide/nickel transport system substrate-binding protein
MVPSRDVQKLKNAKNVAVNSRPGASQINLYVNQRTFEPFTNKKMRKALGYGSNKQAIIASQFNGLAVPGWSIFPPWHWAYDESAVTKYPYNPKKAQQLVKEAGQQGLKFNCQPTNQPLFVDTATILQQNYKQIGVEMEITPKEKSVAWEPTIGGWDPKAFPPADEVGPPSDFNSLVEDITYGFNADGYSYITFHTDAWLNVSYYSNEKVDTLLEDARRTTDRAERKKLYSQAQSIITDDIPQIFQVWWNVNQGYRTSIHNFQTYPAFTIVLEEVWKGRCK